MFGSSHCEKVKKEIEKCIDLPRELISIIKSYYSASLVSAICQLTEFMNYKPRQIIHYKDEWYVFYPRWWAKHDTSIKANYQVGMESLNYVGNDHVYILDCNIIRIWNTSGKYIEGLIIGNSTVPLALTIVNHEFVVQYDNCINTYNCVGIMISSVPVLSTKFFSLINEQNICLDKNTRILTNDVGTKIDLKLSHGSINTDLILKDIISMALADDTMWIAAENKIYMFKCQFM